MFGLLKKWWKPSDHPLGDDYHETGPNVEELFDLLHHPRFEENVRIKKWEELEYGGVLVQRIHNRSKETSRHRISWSNGYASVPYWYETIFYRSEHLSIKIQRIEQEKHVCYYHDITWKEEQEEHVLASDHLFLPSGSSFRQCKKENSLDVLEDEKNWSHNDQRKTITLELDKQYLPLIWASEPKRILKQAKKEIEKMAIH